MSFFEATGHYYEYIEVQDGITWTEAKAAAETKAYMGLPGHLATVQSEAENTFISSGLKIPGATWIGGFQDPEGVEPDGGWQWITGGPWTYEYWVPGREPNNGPPSDEDYLNTYGTSNSEPLGSWNTYTDSPLNGYIVEYEAYPIVDIQVYASITFTEKLEKNTESNIAQILEILSSGTILLKSHRQQLQNYTSIRNQLISRNDSIA